MDEHNPPVALPNGQVYSLKVKIILVGNAEDLLTILRKGLKLFAQKNNGKYYCPITKESFNPSDAMKIYIS